MMFVLLSMLVLTITALNDVGTPFVSAVPSTLCHSPQYLELGHLGTINCEFPEDFFAVFWYNSSDYLSTDPILALRKSEKTGPGYESGEFDAYPNGTLIINRVMEKHDGIFTVAYLQTAQEVPVVNEIRVIVDGNQSVTTLPPPKRFCHSPQYLELGYLGTINCEFPEDFFAVFWYNSSDYLSTDPILALRKSGKTGPGYESGEFDAYPNGTLIINRVMEKHDGIFTVAYLQTAQERPVVNEIRVIVDGNQSVTTLPPPKRFCHSPQYLELGHRGTIDCEFPEDFFAVFWYNSSDYLSTDPSLVLRKSGKTGPGYESGEFDAYPNGTLIINRVMEKYDGIFTVAYLQRAQERPVVIKIRVIVFVKPEIPFPRINKCGNQSNMCYAEIDVPIKCSVQGIKPLENLTWMARTLNGDQAIDSNLTTYHGKFTYTSQVETNDAFHFSQLLVLLVCKVFSPPNTELENEASILAQNSIKNITPAEKTFKHFERSSKMVLSCTNITVGFVVWKKVSLLNESQTENILYSVLIGEQYTKTFVDDVTVDINGSLVVFEVGVKHEGTYICVSGDGLRDGWTSYEVIVTVNPLPGYPIIEGCNNQDDCVLQVEYMGNLTCAVKGVRPKVKLEWKTFYDQYVDMISFENHQPVIKNNGETFDVFQTVTFHVINQSLDRMTIECKVQESEEMFHLSTVLGLLLPKGNKADNTDDSGGFRVYFFLIPMVVAYIYSIFAQRRPRKFLLKKIRKCCQCNLKKRPKDEDISRRLLQGDHLQDEKDDFVKQLKQTYANLFRNAHPIPYVEDRLQHVEKVFALGSIKFQLSQESEEQPDEWKYLTSYEDIFKDPQVKSTRYIIEGESGYGKTTIALQFARDWCNPKKSSPLRDVEVLILLHLRQLGKVSSIFKAIKMFTLTDNTTLSEEKIESIISSCQSVVVILEGFDEYAGSDSTACTDIIKIISGEMFPLFQVITTTRSSFLPQKYPACTRLLKLTGLDEDTRRNYIHNTVARDGDDVQTIEGYLRQTPILYDLCQVPFLFVMFVQTAYESEQFRELKSLTRLFHFLMSSIHCHMRNKMGNESASYTSLENDHRKLDKLAFETLKIFMEGACWRKDELQQQLGQDMYDWFMRVGILVEEEVIGIIDDTDTPITAHVQYNREKRCTFYHKIFCEWFAAHYLSDYIQQNPDVDLNDFLHALDPSNVQYLYRFACGLNTISAENIIAYLVHRNANNTYVSLCMLEQDESNLNISQQVSQLCDERISISNHHSLLLQRSLVSLIVYADNNNIHIKLVVLENCIESVDSSGKSININSNVSLHPLKTVDELQVIFTKREISEEDAAGIIRFSARCPSLKCLKFRDCIAPMLFKTESIISPLQEWNIAVLWQPSVKHLEYELDPSKGRWKQTTNGRNQTKSEYDKLRLEIVGPNLADLKIRSMFACLSYIITLFVCICIYFFFEIIFLFTSPSFVGTILFFFIFAFVFFFIFWLNPIILRSIYLRFLENRQHQEDDEEHLLQSTEDLQEHGDKEMHTLPSTSAMQDSS